MPTITQSQIDALRNKGLTDDKINTIAQQRGYELPRDGFWKKAGKALIKSEVGFGQSLAGAMGGMAPKGSLMRKLTGQSAIDESNAMNQQVTQNLITKIKEKRARGEDTTRLMNALKTMDKEVNFYDILNSSTGGSLDKNAKQVFGEGFGVATDILGAGALPGGVGKVAKATSAWQGIKTGAKAGAISGTIFGAAKGGTGAMQDNLSGGEIAGRTVGGGILGGAGGAIIGGTIGGVSGAIRGRPARVQQSASNKVTEMISPKATIREARLAQSQGRLVEGRKAGFFRGGTEDTILPSTKTQSATKTVLKNIPNARKMSPPELYKAIDKKITTTATKLRPKMKATLIKPETVEKIDRNWKELKQIQMSDAPATEEMNVLKRQSKFESFLKKSKAGTHEDLWDTRIEYDKSVPDAVKKANNMSSESLQLQKEEWLDNRRILSEAFEDSTKPEFKTMTDLYEARNGLMSNTKIQKGQPSTIRQIYDSKTGKVIRTVAKYGVGYELLKRGFGE